MLGAMIKSQPYFFASNHQSLLDVVVLFRVLPVPLLSCISFGPPLWLEAGEPKADFLDRAREAVRRLKDI